MMFINHNPFSLNDLIATSSFQQSLMNTSPPSASASSAPSTNFYPYPHPAAQQLYANSSINLTSKQSNTSTNNVRSNSASSLSSVSSTSSNKNSMNSPPSDLATAAATPATNQPIIHQPNQPAYNKNMSLSNNCNLFSFNFAYINPPLGFNSATQVNNNNLVQQAQPYLTTQGSKIQGINDSLICRTKDVNNTSVLNPLNSNYSFNVLPNKNSNLGHTAQFSTSPHTSTTTATSAGLLNSEPSLNCNNSLLFFNPTAKTQQTRATNFYNHYDPIAYLPSNDLFLSNTNDQTQFTAATYLTGPSLSELTAYPTIVPTLQQQQQQQQHQAKSLTFNPKSPFTLQNGIKKRKKRFKKPPELRKVLPKNSLMVLHELRPNVEYRFLCQNGPIHRPTFKMCVEIEEHKFEGIGRTKKEARMMAAERAVEFLLQHPEYIQKTKSQSGAAEQEEAKRMNDSENDENNGSNNNNEVGKLEDTSSNDESSDSEEASQKRFKS